MSEAQAHNNSEKLGDEEYSLIQQLAKERAGIILTGERHRSMVQGRLSRRVRALNVASLKDYCAMLKSQTDMEEFEHFVNAITTNVTSFFREAHHFEHLKIYLEELITRPEIKASKRIRLWSSASSSGEEPYSIAMTVLDILGDQQRHGWDIKILATDLDTNILEDAKAGKYTNNFQEALPEGYAKKYTKPADEEGTFEIKQNVKDIIHFKHLNLLKPWKMKGPFDVIFCRNVFIYFSAETQKEIATRFAGLLRAGGMLYIGHSENLLGMDSYFKNSGKTCYERLGNV